VAGGNAPFTIEPAEEFTQPPLDQIARYGVADALTDNNAIPIMRRAIRQDQQRQVAATPGAALRANVPVICLAAQAQAPVHLSRPLAVTASHLRDAVTARLDAPQPALLGLPGPLIAHRQFVATLQAAAGQDIAAILGEHAVHETMLPQARAPFRLPGALDHG